MEISARKGVYALYVTHKGEELEWRFGVWATLARKTGEETSEELTEEQFGATNEYIASLPEQVQDDMFQAYKEAHGLLSEYATREEMQKIYLQYAPKIFQHINEDHMLQWAKENGRIHIEPAPPLRSVNNPQAMRYTEDESFNLSAFCIVVKILAPMMGSYVELVREKSVRSKAATLHKEMQAAELFFSTKLVTFKTYLRLEEYLEVYAARRQGSLRLGTRYDMATADLSELMKGLTIVRRLMLATVRSDKNGAIIAFIYMFLEEKITDLAKDVAYKSKFASRKTDDQEDESYTDNFRKPENVDQGTIAVMDDDLSDWKYYARFLGLDDHELLTAEAICDTLRDNKHFHITDIIHYPIVGMLIKELTYHRMIDKIYLDTFLPLIAMSAVYCAKMGWEDIAELLVAYRYDIDPGHMPLNSRNGVSYRRLTAELDQELAAQYQYLDQQMIAKPTNQGKMWIEAVIEAVLSYQWSGLTEPSYLRHSLAEFIIKRPLKTEVTYAEVTE